MPRPLLAFLIALVAISVAQVFNWSSLVGFCAGWLLLVAVLTHRHVAELVRAGVAWAWPRLFPLRLRVWAQQVLDG